MLPPSLPAQEGEHLYLQLERCDVSLGIHASLGEQLREGELLEVLRQVGPGTQRRVLGGMHLCMLRVCRRAAGRLPFGV
jgi:hypothetical protein